MCFLLLLLAGAQDLFGKLKEGMDPGFRLFITALPNDEFPLGLLQMCTKVCVYSWEEDKQVLSAAMTSRKHGRQHLYTRHGTAITDRPQRLGKWASGAATP